MSDEEHLVENIMVFMEQSGWNQFNDVITIDDIKTLNIEYLATNGSIKVSTETLAWLLTLGRYVDYHHKMDDYCFYV